MNSPDHRQLVLNAYAAISSGDLDAFYSCFHEDVVLHEAESLPYGGCYRGLAELKHGVAKVFDAWADFRFHVEEVAAAGDMAFVYLHGCGTGKKTGKTFAFPFVEVWRFRQGKVIELRPFYWDTNRARECFGD
jgi:ketosteroid isomerase-like protein